MKRFITDVGKLVVVLALIYGIWQLNTWLGVRTGEIDCCVWWIQGDAEYTHYVKGLEGNVFLGPEQVEQIREQLKELGEYHDSVIGYGAIWTQYGWLGDAYISSSGWHIFDSEREAAQFLRDNGVSADDIYYSFR